MDDLNNNYILKYFVENTKMDRISAINGEQKQGC